MVDEANAPGSPEDGADGEELVELMKAYQAGEMEAFEDLFAVLGRQVRAYLISLTRDPEQAEDLLQEAFLQMHTSRHTYTPPRPVKPWVFGIAKHCYLMDRRKRARRGRRERPPREELPDLPVDAFAEQFSEREGLGEALAQVTDKRREALLLHFVWGFSFREIGSMLGISRSAAKVRSHRGMKDLREMLKDEERRER